MVGNRQTMVNVVENPYKEGRKKHDYVMIQYLMQNEH